MESLGSAQTKAARGAERKLPPPDPLVRREPQLDDVGSGVWIGAAEPGRIVILWRMRSGPPLPGLDVLPLAVEQPETGVERGAALFVELVCLPCHAQEKLGMPPLGCVPLRL